MSYNVAIVGATGNVGREMLNILDEREFPVNKAFAIASRRSTGVEFFVWRQNAQMSGSGYLRFSQCDFALMSAGGDVSKEWSPKIGRTGRIVIDNSSAWRFDRRCRSWCPKSTRDALAGYRRKTLSRTRIARQHSWWWRLSRSMTPQGSSGWSSRPISPFPAPAKTRWTSFSGKPRAVFVARSDRRGRNSPSRSRSTSSRISTASWKTATRAKNGRWWPRRKKILDPKIKLTATCVRVPVFVGHSEAVTIEFERPITAEEAREILREAPGLLVVDKREDGGYITPVEAAGDFATYRQPHSRGPHR